MEDAELVRSLRRKHGNRPAGAIVQPQEHLPSFARLHKKCSSNPFRCSSVHERDPGMKTVTLCIGGTTYATTCATLLCVDSFFTSMLSGLYEGPRTSSGDYFVDRDGKAFRHILEYLRARYYNDDSYDLPAIKGSALRSLLAEARFYQLADLVRLLEAKLGAEDGSKAQAAADRAQAYGPLVDSVYGAVRHSAAQFPQDKVDALVSEVNHGMAAKYAAGYSLQNVNCGIVFDSGEPRAPYNMYIQVLLLRQTRPGLLPQAAVDAATEQLEDKVYGLAGLPSPRGRSSSRGSSHSSSSSYAAPASAAGKSTPTSVQTSIDYFDPPGSPRLDYTPSGSPTLVLRTGETYSLPPTPFSHTTAGGTPPGSALLSSHHLLDGRVGLLDSQALISPASKRTHALLDAYYFQGRAEGHDQQLPGPEGGDDAPMAPQTPTGSPRDSATSPARVTRSAVKALFSSPTPSEADTDLLQTNSDFYGELPTPAKRTASFADGCNLLYTQQLPNIYEDEPALGQNLLWTQCLPEGSELVQTQPEEPTGAPPVAARSTPGKLPSARGHSPGQPAIEEHGDWASECGEEGCMPMTSTLANLTELPNFSALRLFRLALDESARAQREKRRQRAQQQQLAYCHEGPLLGRVVHRQLA
ncbi:hypothetical protein WJX72_010414 [[Myrmecia] bisecta]|uniref:BTB domain-containing protein n=1 Tax=[Myrmecia] bisecta TaxID=41462 RepID=A0AAW1PH66_9CHLO